MHDIERRLVRVERENRIMRRWGVASLVLAGAVTIAGMATPPGIQDEVRALKFVAVDAMGRERAVIDDDGLYLADVHGNPRAALTEADENYALMFFSAKGTLGASLLVPPTGLPELTLFDKEGTERVVLRVTANTAGLDCMDANGVIRASIGMAKSGPVLLFCDAARKPRVGLTETSLDFGDANGKPVWTSSPATGRSGAR